jgi:2-polyprenyl-6-methoxyphenol hydroxylase-like FAD-dependent oxidoreductase
MTRHAVVSGASIAGLSAAYWLRRTGWDVTVLERAEEFRDGGQNVDVRGVAKDVLDRMGLVDVVKELNTTETGTVIVDADGEVTTELPFGGEDGATAELEVLRGDLARALLDHLPSGVTTEYGDPIDEVRDVEGSSLTLRLVSGRELTADLLVVAEGVRSTTRDRVFGDVVEERPLGVNMVFGTIPRTADDDDHWRWHNTVGGRQIHLRPDRQGTTRAMLAWAGDDDLTGREPAEVLATARERYADGVWAAPRILDGLARSDDVYADYLTMIRVPSWRRGRVVLTGDAAWCVTPLGGGGASLALTGGYVLAAYLRQHEDDQSTALAAYEDWLRPVVDDAQHLPPGVIRFAYPRSRVGLALRRVAEKAIASAPLRPLAARMTDVADPDRDLPGIPD